MPPSATKRSTRTRKQSQVQLPSDPDEVDATATPSRKRKRGANGTPRQPDVTTAEPPRSVSESSKRKTRSADVHLVEDEASFIDDDVDTVIRNLKKAKYTVQARSDHANEVHEIEHPEGKQAFAKIAGNGWTYYVDDLVVHIGRPPDEKQIEPHTPGQSVTDKTVNIDLGPSKLISRKHAEIRYQETNGQWYLNVTGRNGLKLDEEIMPRGSNVSLHSGSVIDVAGTQMMFVTPNEEPTIHPTILAQVRAQRDRPEDEDEEEPEKVQIPLPPPQRTPVRAPSARPMSQHTRNESGSIDITSSVQHYGKLGYNNSFAVPGATAIPGEEPMDPRIPSSQIRIRTSPAYARGLVLESADDIDYSQDSAKDLKPPHSYAQLIGMAILSSSEEKLTLSKIYDWIKERYAFYRFSGGGWQNSIRHNLSLNKCFEKVARRTDEPGKGMKWQIVPEHKEEFVKKGLNSARKPTMHGSTDPNSPMFNMPSSADPDRRLSQSFLRDAFANSRDVGDAFVKTSPTSTPPRLPYPLPKQAFTPDRGGAMHGQNNTMNHSSPQHPLNQNYSPYPYGRGQSRLAGLTEAAAAASGGGLPMFGGSDSDTQLYTPLITRHAPKLVPPSTARLPSHFMPLSSPAPFWKYAADFGSTPAHFDQFGSPLKVVRLNDGKDRRNSVSTKPAQEDNSSSPGDLPDAGQDSPTRQTSSRGRDVPALPQVPIEKIPPLQPPISLSSQSAPQTSSSTTQPQLQPAVELSGPSLSQQNKLMPPPPMPDEEEDGDEQGFDLSKGFQPIGSFHRNMTATVIRGN